MAHAVFTIVTPVVRQRLATLDAVLAEVAANPDGNPYVRFPEIPTLHFASFVVLERDTAQPLLVFESSVDVTAKAYLQQLLTAAGDGLDGIYQNVQGYPGDGDAAARLQFLLGRLVRANLHHVGTPAMSVRDIQSDRSLREALETNLDHLVARPPQPPPSPASLWRSLADKVRTPPSLNTDWQAEVDAGGAEPIVSWIPTRGAGRADRLRAWSVAALIAAALVVPLAVLFGLLLARRLVALTLGYVILAVAVALISVILSGWPAKRPLHRVSWPALRLILVAAGVALAAALIVRIPIFYGWLEPWTKTWPSWRGLGAGLILLGIWGVPLGVMFYLSDEGILNVPSPEGKFTPLTREARANILDAEDRDVQNHMAAVVRIDPVWYRVWSLRLFLFVLFRLYYRTRLTKGKLVTIPTVHFAQWTLLDGGRFLFLSNYDHSWSRYLDDFGTRIGGGIVKIWGQGIGFPGIGDLTMFKEYARSTMVPHAVWYSAYPGLTVRQIWTNRRLRTDLFSDVDETEAATRLDRLAAADPL